MADTERQLDSVTSENREKALEKKSNDFLARCKAFTISNNQEYQVGDQARINGRDHIKNIEEFLDPHIARANAVHKGLTGDKKRLIDPVKQGRKLIGDKMEAYDNEIKRQRKIKEDKLRKEAEDKAKKEEKARLLKEAKELKKEGDTDGAEALKEEAKNPVVDPVSINPEILPSTPKTKTSYRDDWDIKVTDKSKVPIEYMEADEAMIKKMVRSTKGKVPVPGVQITPKRIPV